MVHFLLIVLMSSSLWISSSDRQSTYSTNDRNKRNDRVEHDDHSTVAHQPRKQHRAEDAHKDVSGFLYDGYTATRGAPKMLTVCCSLCNHRVITKYQKDGPGRLLRCYLDRIHGPSELRQRQFEAFNTRTSPFLRCSDCSTIIGEPMVYKPENRPAYYLLRGRSYFREEQPS